MKLASENRPRPGRWDGPGRHGEFSLKTLIEAIKALQQVTMDYKFL